MEKAIRLLKEAAIIGNNVKFPQMAVEDYKLVSKLLNKIGGKWDKKQEAIVFEEDPTPYIEILLSGKKINLKQDFQYFPTPENICNDMVRYPALEFEDLKFIQSGKAKILEPSAGRGNIIKAIQSLCDDPVNVDCFELMPINKSFLKNVPGANLIGEDFLKVKPEPIYDFIFANPPFTKGAMWVHLEHMFDFLKPGGFIIILMMEWYRSDNSELTTKAKNVLDKIKGPYDEPPYWITSYTNKEFREEGTNINTELFKIWKDKDHVEKDKNGQVKLF